MGAERQNPPRNRDEASDRLSGERHLFVSNARWQRCVVAMPDEDAGFARGWGGEFRGIRGRGGWHGGCVRDGRRRNGGGGPVRRSEMPRWWGDEVVEHRRGLVRGLPFSRGGGLARRCEDGAGRKRRGGISGERRESSRRGAICLGNPGGPVVASGWARRRGVLAQGLDAGSNLLPRRTRAPSHSSPSGGRVTAPRQDPTTRSPTGRASSRQISGTGVADRSPPPTDRRPPPTDLPSPSS